MGKAKTQRTEAQRDWVRQKRKAQRERVRQKRQGSADTNKHWSSIMVISGLCLGFAVGVGMTIVIYWMNK